ncbi:hypothetical protein KKI24_15550 [bacterium]|nr:hypothetical protein [bacterium]
METYTIKLKRRFLWSKKLKKVKGNFFPDDMNPAVQQFMTEQNGRAVPVMLRQNPVKFMMVVFEDERKLIVNLDKYQGYEISKELFFIKARQAEQESQGQAKVS